MRLGRLGVLAALVACAPKKPTERPARVPPPEADLVYFVMVDRFANGDVSNDCDVDPADPHAFHGGDLQGVIDKVDYLESMGVRTVWLSPIFEMRADKIGEWGAFHGYWVKDLTRVEPRFGTEDTLARLADALHTRGMRLVLDMVYNHTDYDAPIRTEHPGWFHPIEDITDWDDPHQLVYHQVHGLPDLAQEDPEVARYLLDVSTGWIDRAAVDGFRVDAVRHMPVEFLATLNDALDAHAGGEFWTLGEDFQGGAGKLADTWRRGHFDAMFDFPLRYAMVDVFCKNQPVGRLASTLSADRLYDDADSLVTFLDNHDLPRVINECGGIPGQVDQALAFMFTARGTPALTYGTEALIIGDAEPANRASMPWDHLHPAGYESPITGFEELRRLHPSLRDGRGTVLHLDDDRYSYARVTPDESVVVLVNRGGERFQQELPDWLWTDAHVVRIVSLVPDRPVMISTFEEPWHLGETKGRVFAEGHSLEIVFLRADSPGGFAERHAALGRPEMVTVSLAAAAPLAEGETLLAVGADPELGSWGPGGGVVLDGGEGAVDVPAGTVLAFKLVIRGADGASRWEERGDRYLLVADDGAAVQAEWGR